MQFKTEGVILGVSRFNDSVEGNHYDFTKVRVMMPVPEGADNQLGFDVTVIPYGDHKNFEKFENMTFPAKVMLDLRATSKGYDFVGFTPLQGQVKVAA